MAPRLTDLDHVLSTTRSVRKRLDFSRPVERDVILECLRLAIYAPTGGNSQGWRWVVVDDPEQRAKLAAIYRKRAEPYFGGWRNVGAADQPNAVLDSAEYLGVHMHEVPVMVVPCLLGRMSDTPSIEDSSGFLGSILPAVWSFQLALRSRGLGSAFTTLHLPFEEETAALLGIPEGVLQTALIPVAYFKGDDFQPAKRRPVEEITYWNGWKQPRTG